MDMLKTVVNTETIDAEEIILWLITEIQKYNIQKWVMDMYRFLLLKSIFEKYGISIEDKNNPYRTS